MRMIEIPACAGMTVWGTGITVWGAGITVRATGMTKQFARMTKTVSRGFTLIELLIVILIITIALSMALLATGDFGEKRRATTYVESVIDRLKQGRDYARMRGENVRLRIDKKAYLLERYHAKKWQKLPTPFAVLAFAKDTEGKLEGKNQIVFYPDGEATPFTLTITYKEETLANIKGTEDGEITLK